MTMDEIPPHPASLQDAVQAVRRTLPESAFLALILGSGLGDSLEGAREVGSIRYRDIPGLPPPSVKGHEGRLLLLDIDGVRVWVLAGRVHGYEGHPLETVLLPARLAAGLGAKVLVSTNAVGGIRSDLEPGDLAVVTDHLNFMGFNPLSTASARDHGEVFLPLDELYHPGVRQVLHAAGKAAGVPLKEAVYAAFPGPTYETPAEIEMARISGGDVAGMSLVPEALAAHQRGVRVGSIACITNRAAGTSSTPPSHSEVLAAGKKSAEALGAVLKKAVTLLDREFAR